MFCGCAKSLATLPLDNTLDHGVQSLAVSFITQLMHREEKRCLLADIVIFVWTDHPALPIKGSTYLWYFCQIFLLAYQSITLERNSASRYIGQIEQANQRNKGIRELSKHHSG
jgi:hypothetical protein